MPIKPSQTAVVRSMMLQTFERLLLVGPLEPLASPLEHLAGSVYEFSRGASVSAQRSSTHATPAAHYGDILENLRLVLVSAFDRVVDEDDGEEMVTAATEIRNLVLQMKAAS